MRSDKARARWARRKTRARRLQRDIKLRAQRVRDSRRPARALAGLADTGGVEYAGAWWRR